MTPVGGEKVEASGRPTQEAAEFDVETEWMGVALARLDPERQLPGACRGSGPASAYSWLADRLDLAVDLPFLDLGAGLGGPASWLAQREAIRPVLVDQFAGGLRWASRLFGGQGVVSSERLPFPDRSFAGGWCLATLSTVDDLAMVLGELHRVLRPGAALGLQEFVLTAEPLASPPLGNHFLSRKDLVAALEASGFEVDQGAWTDELDDASVQWAKCVEDAKALVRTEHPDSPELRIAEETADRFSALCAEGRIRSWLGVTRRR